MAKLVDLDGLKYFYGKIKAMLADKLGINDVAKVATSGSYNDLSDRPTIVKTVNGVAPDSSGNVTVKGSSDVVELQKFATPLEYNAGTVKPTTVTASYGVDSNLTIDFSNLSAQIGEGESITFRAYIISSSDNSYTLTIKGVDWTLYVGDPIDYAITKFGMLLTVHIVSFGNGAPWAFVDTKKIGV